jgi:hypothetical protein
VSGTGYSRCTHIVRRSKISKTLFIKKKNYPKHFTGGPLNNIPDIPTFLPLLEASLEVFNFEVVKFRFHILLDGWNVVKSSIFILGKRGKS